MMNDIKSTVDAWPLGASEMAARIREHDWAATPLGPMAEWPERLKAAVDNLLASGFAGHLWWGPDLVQIYNDAALPIMRAKHPTLLGIPAREGWSEIWPELAPLVERVLSTGLPETRENLPLLPERGGAVETAYFTFSFSALRDGSGAIAGTLATAIETTKRIRAEAELRSTQERQGFLLKLSDVLQRLATPHEIKTAAMHMVGTHLGVSRAQYHEVDGSGEYYSADGIGYADGLPLLDLKYRIGQFGGFVSEDFGAGRPFRSDDLLTDPRPTREEREAYGLYQIRAGAGIPLLRGGKLVAILAVHDTRPHSWTELEMELIRETAERVWVAVEKVRTDIAVRENEGRKAFLLTLSDRLRTEADPRAIAAASVGLLADHMRLDRAYVARVDKSRDLAEIGPEYRRPDLAPVEGVLTLSEFPEAFAQVEAATLALANTAADQTLSDLDRRGFAALRMGALIVASARKGARNPVWALLVATETPRHWTAAELTLVEEVAERTWAAVERARAEAALREGEKALAADLVDTELLRGLAERLVTEENVGTIYDEILSVAVDIAQSDAGTLQIYDPKAKSLDIIAAHNFSRAVTNYFQRVDARSRTACGIALSTGQRAFVDFPEEVADLGCRLLVGEGFQSAMALPLVSRSGRPLGMLNTHWLEARHRPTDKQLRFLDLIARQTADLIEQRQAQSVLRESEARLRAAFSISTVGVMFWSPSGALTDMNNAFLKMTGFTREEALGKTWHELTPPEFRARSAQFVDEVETTGDGAPYEKQYFRKDGSRWWGLFAARKLDGGLVEFVLDVTDRRDAEARLRQSEERLRLAFEAGGFGAFRWYPAEDRSEPDERTRELLGASSAEEAKLANVLGKRLHPDDVALHAEAVARALDPTGDGRIRNEVRVVRPSGEVRWVATTGQVRFGGDPPTALWMDGIAADVTDRRRAEEALRRSEVRFRTLATASAHLMYRMSPDWRHMYQLSGEGMLVDTVEPVEDWADTYLVPEDRPTIFAAIEEAIRAKSLFELEHRVRQVDGGVGWVVSRAVPILREDGEIVEWFGVGSDVTAKREAEEKLRAAEGQYKSELERQVTERTAELKASRDLLQATMDASTDMIQVFEAIRNEAGEIVDFHWVLNNHTSRSRYGKVEGESLLTRNPGVVQEGIFDAFKRVIETGEPDQAERHYVHEQFDGWFYQSVVKLGDGVATTTKEITAWKQAQEEILRLRDAAAQRKLLESEEKYRSLFEAMDEGYALCELVRNEQGEAVDYRFLEVNPAFERLTGLAARQVNGRLRSEAIPVPDERRLEASAQVVASGEPTRLEYYNEGLGRWYEVGLFPREGDRFASLFADITKRKQAEMALRESEARQTFLLRLADALRLLANPERIQAEACRMVCEHLGAQRVNYADIEGDEYIIRCSHTNGVAPITGRGHVATYGHALLEEYQRNGAIAVHDVMTDSRFDDRQRASYAKVQIAATASTMLIKDGRWVGSFAAHSASARHWTSAEVLIVKETAERIWSAVQRVKVEEALRESEERLRQFGEASSDVLWVRHAETLHWEYLSPAFEAIYGVTVAEALAGEGLSSWVELILPEDRERAEAEIVRVREGKDVIFEYRVRRPDGQVRWLRNTDFPMRDASGRIHRIGGIGQDVTELKRFEAALRESEGRLRTLAEGIPQLVWRSADKGRWTWSSPQWQAFTGQTLDGSLGLGWLDAVHPDDHAEAMRAWEAAKPNGLLDVEYRVRRAADGEYLWHHTRSAPVLGEGGRIVEWLGTSTDVQQLKELQERQGVMVAELQHRTRNLIAVVRSIAQQTMAQTGPTEAFREEFNHRLEALARVQGLLSRSDDEPITIEALIRIELDALGARDGIGERIMVNGPPVRLRHSIVQTLALGLHELATNARKHGALSRDDGRLSVTWRVRQADGEGRRLALEWSETGAEALINAQPDRRGYGRELIERALPYALGAKTTYEIAPEGVRCTIDLPLEKNEPRRRQT